SLPSFQVSRLSGSGFFCFLLPIRKWCFAKFIVPFSNLPGGVALQPITPMRASVKVQRRIGDTSVHHVHCQSHLAVTRATKNRAVADKVAGFVWCERQLRGSTLVDLHVQIEFTKSETVCYVGAFDDEDNRLSLFDSDLRGREFESFGCDLNSARRILGANVPCRGRDGCSKNEQ